MILFPVSLFFFSYNRSSRGSVTFWTASHCLLYINSVYWSLSMPPLSYTHTLSFFYFSFKLIVCQMFETRDIFCYLPIFIALVTEWEIMFDQAPNTLSIWPLPLIMDITVISPYLIQVFITFCFAIMYIDEIYEHILSIYNAL